jgi:hypothetical protein
MQKGHLSRCVSNSIKYIDFQQSLNSSTTPHFKILKHLLLHKTEDPLVKNISSREQEVQLEILNKQPYVS